jgi:hypothetical protein
MTDTLHRAIQLIVANLNLDEYARSSCRQLTDKVNAIPKELQDLVFDHLLAQRLDWGPNLLSRIQAYVDSEIAWGTRLSHHAEPPYPTFSRPHFLTPEYAHRDVITALVERA